jgi:hypothetical protein
VKPESYSRKKSTGKSQAARAQLRTQPAALLVPPRTSACAPQPGVIGIKDKREELLLKRKTFFSCERGLIRNALDKQIKTFERHVRVER